MTTAIIAFCVLSVLLILGKALRVHLPILQKLYLPSSVVGGLLGLLVMSLTVRYAPAETASATKDLADTVRQLPGFLINVIFATLFLGKAKKTRSENMAATAFSQLCLAQLVAWGQYVVGLGLAGFWLAQSFNLPPAFGNLLEIGFEGGHGTVGGLQSLFADKWADGLALGYTVATAGMILGIVLGMFFINIAYTRGYVKTVRPFNERSLHERKGIYPRHSRPNAGHQTVYSDSVDSLAWHVAIIGLAILVGFGMLKGLQAAEAALFPAAKTRIFAGFPLFPLCMLGGVVLQSFARAIGLRLFIDRDQMQRIAGTALDFLSLAAVATIQISVVAQNWQPLLILIVAGAVWTAGSVFWFAPRLFRRAWFERAVTEFGQATGVTATGLLLLRTVDPENKTCAATTFGYKQLFHEPVMNTWVAIAIMLILANPASWWGLWLFCTAVLALWLAAAAVLIHLNRKAARNEKA